MGGSGGGFFSGGTSPDELARRTREAEAEEKAHDDTFETEVGAFLASELTEYNDRDVDGTQKVFAGVKKDLEDDIEGTVDLLFGGSISKHTYVDGLSDVDALVLIDRSEIKDKQPKQLQRLLADCLRARYGKDSVTVGPLAVTLTHDGKSIQLLPAVRDGKRFKIASYDGKGWSRIDPSGFADALTKANKAMDGKLVPCVKLAKAVIATLPEQRRLTGYHTESLAIKVFKDYDGPKTPKAMVRHFFENAPDHVKQPIKDSSGQSVHVDEYLAGANSLQRRIVADALGRIARKIRNVDGARSLDSWKDLF
ncbi:MAG: nucleotidyltransferase [Planctomycetes bacterium]|nr:nucleotidyltransferase [Planctomycetota bacterium]